MTERKPRHTERKELTGSRRPGEAAPQVGLVPSPRTFLGESRTSAQSNGGGQWHGCPVSLRDPVGTKDVNTLLGRVSTAEPERLSVSGTEDSQLHGVELALGPAGSLQPDTRGEGPLHLQAQAPGSPGSSPEKLSSR